MGAKATVVTWGEVQLPLVVEVVRSARSWASWLWASQCAVVLVSSSVCGATLITPAWTTPSEKYCPLALSAS